MCSRLAPAAARRVPPVETGKKIGVVIGGGTDAHRVASYNPFTSLQWFLDGRTVGGTAIRGPEETPDRADALRFCHDRQRLVFVRRQEARFARDRQAGGPGRAVEGLHDGSGGRNSHHRVAAHHGWRPRGLFIRSFRKMKRGIVLALAAWIVTVDLVAQRGGFVTGGAGSSTDRVASAAVVASWMSYDSYADGSKTTLLVLWRERRDGFRKARVAQAEVQAVEQEAAVHTLSSISTGAASRSRWSMTASTTRSKS